MPEMKKESPPSDSSKSKTEPEKVLFKDTRLKPELFDVVKGKIDYSLFKAYPKLVEPSYLGSGYYGGDTEGENILDFLHRSNVNNFSPLPMAVRWMSVHNGVMRVLVELPPQRRTILYNAMRKDKSALTNPTPINLPFPWTQIGFKIYLSLDNNKRIIPSRVIIASLAFAESAIGPRLRSDKKIYHTCLPNTYKNGGTCFSATISTEEGSRMGFADIIKKGVNEYLGTTFNHNMPGASHFSAPMLEFNGADTKRKQTKHPTDTDGFSDLFNFWGDLSVTDILDLEGLKWRRLDLNEARHYSEYRFDLATNRHYSEEHFGIGPALEKKLMRDRDASRMSAPLKNGTIAKVDINDVNKYEPYVSVLQQIETLKRGITLNQDPFKPTYQTYKGSISPVSGTVSFAQQKPTKTRSLLSARGKVEIPPEVFTLKLKSLEESLQILAGNLDTGQHPLPPGLRHWNPISQIIVFERPPGIRKVTYYPANRNSALRVDAEDKTTYKIWVPWTQYWVAYNAKNVITDLWVTSSTDPMSTNDVHLGTLPLPNLYFDARVCLPNVEKCDDITTMIATAYNAVWNTNYNQDLVDVPRHFVGHARSAYIMKYGKKRCQELFDSLLKDTVNTLKADSLPYEQAVLKWWSKSIPSDLLKIIPVLPPISEYSSADHIDDFDCGCDPDDCCGCTVDTSDTRRIMTPDLMIQHVRDHRSAHGWLEQQVVGYRSTSMTTYDKMLKHAQAYQAKALH